MEDHQLCVALSAFSSEVRESSVKRFRLVRPEHRLWRQRQDLLSFVDVLKHLVDADHWLFDVLDGMSASSGVTISSGEADAQAWDTLLREFIQLGTERCRRIDEFTKSDFSQRQFDLGKRGLVSLSNLILRFNIDHEIHHRGALQLSLRLLYG
ncbi:MAG: DinB family protein [Tepidisphaeraceae bacterium]|jgi:uncharacterized damage-inducible protein DinB